MWSLFARTGNNCIAQSCQTNAAALWEMEDCSFLHSTIPTLFKAIEECSDCLQLTALSTLCAGAVWHVAGHTHYVYVAVLLLWVRVAFVAHWITIPAALWYKKQFQGMVVCAALISWSLLFSFPPALSYLLPLSHREGKSMLQMLLTSARLTRTRQEESRFVLPVGTPFT